MELLATIRCEMGSVEPFYVELGRRIQQLRQKRGLTQDELGRLLEPTVTRASIANIECGKQRVMAHTIVQLVTALETDLTTLIPIALRVSRSSHIAGSVASELAAKLALPPRELKELTTQILNSTGRKRS
jgi:transcriptional regulator with XRE-family HTH domain